MKPNLPNDFHEKLLSLENNLFSDRSIGVIEELTKMYKLGAEFYSGISVTKQNHYSVKLQELYMDKKTLKLIENHNKQKNQAFSKQVKFANFEKHNDEESHEEEINIKFKEKRSKTLGNNNNTNYFDTKKKRVNFVSDKIQSNSSVFPRKQYCNNNGTDQEIGAHIDSEIKEVNTVIDKFNFCYLNSNKLLEENLNQQKSTFLERYKKKKESNINNINYPTKKESTKKATTGLGLSNEYITFLNTETVITEQNVQTIKKRQSFFEMPLVNGQVKSFNLSLKTQSKLLKFKKKSLSINEIFEDFTNKFHYIYFLNLCDIFFRNSVSLLNENYHKKKEQYFKYEDQIKELNIMFADSDSYNDQFAIMVEELENQRTLALKPLELDLRSNIQGLYKFLEMAYNSEFQEKLSDIIDDLIKNVINIIK